MGIQIASLFAAIGADTSGLNKGLGSAKQSLEGFGGEVAKQVIGVASLSAAIFKAGQVVVDSVRDWADYADGMRLSAQMAGITTEEMSRLVQAADDFRVPMETVQKSMEMALKNGFVPTIENLAALSDQLLGITDPAARAAAASKIFGKSYADMMPFLLAGGDAIRNATANIDSSLVVTKNAAEEAKAYKDQLDALGDAWTGLKNILGQSLVPVITQAFAGATEELTRFTLQFLLAKAAIEDFNLTGGATFEDTVRRLWIAFGSGTTTTEQLKDELTKLGYSFGTTSEAAETTSAVVNNTDLSAARDEYLATAKTLREDLAGAYDAVKDAEDNWKSGIAGQIKVELDEKKNAGQLDTQGYINALETLDSYAGTQYAYEFKIEENIPDLVKTLLEDPTGFLSKMSGFEGAMMPLDNSVKNAMDRVAELQLALEKLERVYHARVEVSTGVSTGGGLPNVTPGFEVPHGPVASGGLVFGGTPYIVGERGPELFVPNANGQVVPNNELGGNNAELLGALSRLPTAREIATAVRDALILAGA